MGAWTQMKGRAAANLRRGSEEVEARCPKTQRLNQTSALTPVSQATQRGGGVEGSGSNILLAGMLEEVS